MEAFYFKSNLVFSLLSVLVIIRVDDPTNNAAINASSRSHELICPGR